MKESNCKVFDCGSHVRRIMIRVDGKVKDEIFFVAEGHDVERVTAIFKNPRCYEMLQSIKQSCCGTAVCMGCARRSLST